MWGVYACVCGWLPVCICMSTATAHTPVYSLCIRVSVCEVVLGGPFNSVSISSYTWGSWWWSGTRATLPTQHQKLLMSYCCTLLWNIIALWCVNKAGACCHSICSPAGQTGTTSWGSREVRGRSRKRRKAPGSGWSVVFGAQESWLALLWKMTVDSCLCAIRNSTVDSITK